MITDLALKALIISICSVYFKIFILEMFYKIMCVGNKIKSHTSPHKKKERLCPKLTRYIEISNES